MLAAFGPRKWKADSLPLAGVRQMQSVCRYRY